jgi:hypothetical protein
MVLLLLQSASRDDFLNRAKALREVGVKIFCVDVGPMDTIH